jgi:hypothetical protein
MPYEVGVHIKINIRLGACRNDTGSGADIAGLKNRLAKTHIAYTADF